MDALFGLLLHACMEWILWQRIPIISCSSHSFGESFQLGATSPEDLMSCRDKNLCHTYIHLSPDNIISRPSFVFYSVCSICLSGKRVCEFPGEPEHGSIEPTKFHYDVGEGVAIVCKQSYQSIGPAFIYCTSGGNWSSGLTDCQKITSRPDLDYNFSEWTSHQPTQQQQQTVRKTYPQRQHLISKPIHMQQR